ncbi:MAG: DUF2946 family protein [Halofilum sp. (in: g-proteobacteria)]|nr:DUF2946 family protein [Halofilum sp. (in: g-proteobacteria)]
MDDSVRAAMAKWPDVPAVYGWLSLDVHGHWRLRGEPITHPGLVAFINRNYDCDHAGRWFFQNGPQRGYVHLEYTPWVLQVDTAGTLRRHTDDPVEDVRGAWLDEEGNLLLETDAGIGVVASDALPVISDWLVDAGGDPLAPERLEPGADAGGAAVAWGERRLPLAAIARAEVPDRFGFVPDPQPPGTGGR